MHSSYKTLNFRHSIANKSKREKYRRKDRKIDNTKIDRQTIPRQIDRNYVCPNFSSSTRRKINITGSAIKI